MLRTQQTVVARHNNRCMRHGILRLQSSRRPLAAAAAGARHIPPSLPATRNPAPATQSAAAIMAAALLLASSTVPPEVAAATLAAPAAPAAAEQVETVYIVGLPGHGRFAPASTQLDFPAMLITNSKPAAGSGSMAGCPACNGASADQCTCAAVIPCGDCGCGSQGTPSSPPTATNSSDSSNQGCSCSGDQPRAASDCSCGDCGCGIPMAACPCSGCSNAGGAAKAAAAPTKPVTAASASRTMVRSYLATTDTAALLQSLPFTAPPTPAGISSSSINTPVNYTTAAQAERRYPILVADVHSISTGDPAPPGTPFGTSPEALPDGPNPEAPGSNPPNDNSGEGGAGGTGQPQQVPRNPMPLPLAPCPAPQIEPMPKCPPVVSPPTLLPPAPGGRAPGAQLT